MPFIQTERLNIHYETAGAGQNVLVLVHGNFASWRWWQPVFDRLPANYQAYALDLRGCGDTDHPDDGYTIEQLTDDLYAFATKLGLPPFHLVGHSLGGAVAMQFALEYPELVKTLLLVAPAPDGGLAALQRHNGKLAQLSPDNNSLDYIKTHYRLMQMLGVNRPLLVRPMRKVTPTLADDEMFDVILNDAARMAPEALTGFYQSLDRWNIHSCIKHVDVPMLILAGAQDALVPVAALTEMRDHLKQGQLVVWEDVGHSPQLEQPDRFMALIKEFVTAHSTPPPRPKSIPKPPDSWFDNFKNGLGRFFKGAWQRQAS